MKDGLMVCCCLSASISKDLDEYSRSTEDTVPVYHNLLTLHRGPLLRHQQVNSEYDK